MKKTGLIIVLLLLFVSVSGAAVTDDKEFRTGLKYYNSKNYKAAVRQFREYVEKKPDPAAYYMLGYSLYKLRNFNEAEEYFSEAYFIDPEFSLDKAGLIRKPSGEVARKRPAVKKAPVAMSAESAEKQPEPAAKEALPAKPGKAAPAEQKPKAPVPAPAKTSVPATAPATAASKSPAPTQAPTKPPAPAPASKPAPNTGPAPVPAPAEAPKQVAPPQTAPVPAPSIPAMKPPQMPKEIPGAAAPLLVGIMAAFGMFFFIIAIAFYVFVSLCLYLIAKKLNVPAPWTAWIPIVNLWTIVACAGKPAWWLIFYLIPVVNFFFITYLYMCITENLGKNKWLGLLMLVPLVNMGFLGWLAFSKPESYGGPSVE